MVTSQDPACFSFSFSYRQISIIASGSSPTQRYYECTFTYAFIVYLQKPKKIRR
jgi:hypothetical protein